MKRIIAQLFFVYGCFAYRIDKIGFADSSVQDMKREQGMQLFYRNAMGIRITDLQK